MYVLLFLIKSVAITNYAFHERWYQYSRSVKRIFMFMIMANSLDIKLSTFEKYNLSLSSFMAVSFPCVVGVLHILLIYFKIL